MYLVELAGDLWSSFVNIHPFAPIEQTKGYENLIKELNAFLIEITGFDSISMQPNSGSQGEYAGLLLIRAYHLFNGNSKRNICLIRYYQQEKNTTKSTFQKC